MKFLSLLAFLAASTVQAGENPKCVLSAIEGYGNCKTFYYVSGASDALWCVSESDCLKVFPEPTLSPTEPPVSVSAVEAAVSSSTKAQASSSVLLVAAIVALW